MRILKTLMALTAAGAITTSAHAAPFNGWLTLYPNRVTAMSITDTATIINTDQNYTGCGGGTIRIDKTSPMHDRMFVLWNIAIMTGKTLDMWVQCDTKGAYATNAIIR